MPPRINRDGKKLPKLVGELRKSQMLTTFGSGSLIDFPRFSGIIAGLDNWPVDTLPESAKIHERNLELLLGKEYFYQVSSPEFEPYKTFSIPAYRFPSWYYCPSCHRLDKYNNISRPNTANNSKYNSDLYCNLCSTKQNKVKLIPSRFVAACVNGHIQDFPYVWWCHRKKGMCENPRLYLEYKGNTGGLDSIHIRCETCGAETTMAGCMDKEALLGLKCDGLMPWLGFTDHKWYVDPEQCKATLRCLQRSANNVYYSVNNSALTIPPWSEKIQRVLASRNSLFEDIFDDEEDETKRRLAYQFKKHPEDYGNDFDAFMKAAYARYGDAPEDIDAKSLRCDEYLALRGEEIDHEFFRTEYSDLPEIMKPYFRQIKLVKKLREVMVLQGFRRILPSSEEDPTEREKMGMSNREFAPLSREPKPWLPAVELFGEGIFFELKEDVVKEWEAKHKDRYKKMSLNHRQGEWIGNGMFSADYPRYVLLHTLSHLLIRQLTAQSGYATASIKEKIYSTYPDKDTEMCGILIYTSASDTDGSLGGLVREGCTDRIGDTFMNMLQESSWCSNDPLCVDSKSQGYLGLNYAACHACTLLPETSCEAFNCLLDRAAIVGTPEDKELSFFADIL